MFNMDCFMGVISDKMFAANLYNNKGMDHSKNSKLVVKAPSMAVFSTNMLILSFGTSVA